MKYKIRFASKKILEYLEIFPVVVVTGSRQSGKSTLLKHLFGTKWSYYSLDERGLIENIRKDPDLFISTQKTNFIIDEAQKLPEIFHAIKHRVDQGFPYKIILSGSANFLLLSQVTESLAGRAGIIELHTFCWAELNETKRSTFLSSILKSKSIAQLSESVTPENSGQVISNIFYGGYPKIWEFKKDSQKKIWFENFRTTYLERDLRNLSQVANINDFQRYYEMLSYQVGNLLNLTNIARDIGITTNTSKKYLSILVSSYQYFTLQPYILNYRKRLVKTPKIYAFDTGLANYLSKFIDIDELLNSGRYGNIFENWIIAELLKQASFGSEKMNFYFWRTSNGAEVDLVIEYGQRLIPVEIKSTSNLQRASLKGLTTFLLDFSNKKEIPLGIILYQGDRILNFSKDIIAIPVNCIL